MYLGIDLGGTNIAAGIVDEDGKILIKDSAPTLAKRDYTEIVKDMALLCDKIIKKAGLDIKDIKCAGIGCPGSVDYENGVLIYANNFSSKNIPLRDEFQKYFNIPTFVENDANAAAYGEYINSGNECDVFLEITLGTGIGGGVIINNEIFSGSNGSGTEFGHMTLVHNGIQCTCGKKGCWEAYGSVSALIQQTKTAMAKHPESLMHVIAKEQGEVNGKTAFDAAKKGDLAGQSVVNNYIEYVADGIVSVVNIFQPNKLLIGGGISKEGTYLLEPIKKYVEKYDYNKRIPKVEINVATLRNDAGIVGAAFIAKKNEN